MKKFPISKDVLETIINKYPTPFYLFDEKQIIERVNRFNKAFSWNEGFKEHFAVKALPTPAILRLMKRLGCGVDVASDVELVLASKCGFTGNEMVFSSNQTHDEDYLEALKDQAIINLDAYEQIDNLLNVINNSNYKMPETLCFRYNPGKFSVPASFIGELSNSKFGMTYDQLISAIDRCKNLGVKHFGIHSMLAGNAVDEDYYPLLAKEVFNVVVEIKNKLDVCIEFVDFGGGLGIDYIGENEIDIENIGSRVKKAYEEILIPNGINLRIMSEVGRYLTGPCGYLVCKVIGEKKTYKNYLGIDACMADLMRPGMYGSYHHISVLNDNKDTLTYDVVGSLCENNDKFAVDRVLPKTEIGDILIIHDAGAHGRSMGFNYNGRLRCGELLYRQNDEVELIRRKETMDDYFATFDVDKEFSKFIRI